MSQAVGSPQSNLETSQEVGDSALIGSLTVKLWQAPGGADRGSGCQPPKKGQGGPRQGRRTRQGCWWAPFSPLYVQCGSLPTISGLRSRRGTGPTQQHFPSSKQVEKTSWLLTGFSLTFLATYGLTSIINEKAFSAQNNVTQRYLGFLRGRVTQCGENT